MTAPAQTYSIWSPGKRLQHLLYALAFFASFLTGIALPGGNQMLRGALVAFFGGLNSLFWWHAFFGLASLAVILGHLLYLGVRSYIESLPWKVFPLWFGRPALRALPGELADALRGRPATQERYSAQRRALYWLFLGGGLAASLSGFALRFWDWLDSPAISSSLGPLGAVHGGSAFLLAILLVWHCCDLLDAGRRLPLLKVAVSGKLTAEQVRLYYPEEYRRIKEQEGRRAQDLLQKDQDQVEDTRRTEERVLIEQLLDVGNRLAREGRHLEAAAEYRRALERFPAYSQAQYNLALVLEKGGRTAEALREYERFMEIDPFHPLADLAGQAIRRLKGGGP